LGTRGSVRSTDTGRVPWDEHDAREVSVDEVSFARSAIGHSICRRMNRSIARSLGPSPRPSNPGDAEKGESSSHRISLPPRLKHPRPGNLRRRLGRQRLLTGRRKKEVRSCSRERLRGKPLAGNRVVRQCVALLYRRALLENKRGHRRNPDGRDHRVPPPVLRVGKEAPSRTPNLCEDGRTDKWTNGQMSMYVNGSMVPWADGFMGSWVHGRGRRQY